jgi:hypothetical protein
MFNTSNLERGDSDASFKELRFKNYQYTPSQKAEKYPLQQKVRVS